jgi:hypothetical protein
MIFINKLHKRYMQILVKNVIPSPSPQLHIYKFLIFNVRIV